MYTSIRRYVTSDAAAVTSRVRAEFVPLIAAQPGFIAYQLIDAGQGEMLSVSTFTSSEQAEASNELAQRWVRANTVAYVDGPPIITAGEVVAAQGLSST